MGGGAKGREQDILKQAPQKVSCFLTTYAPISWLGEWGKKEFFFVWNVPLAPSMYMAYTLNLLGKFKYDICWYKLTMSTETALEDSNLATHIIHWAVVTAGQWNQKCLFKCKWLYSPDYCIIKSPDNQLIIGRLVID